MQDRKAIGRRYAEALVNIMADGGDYRTLDDELQQYLKILSDHPGMIEVIRDPSLGRTARLHLVIEVAEMLELSDVMRGLLHLLIQKERFRALPDIAQEYHRIFKKRLDIVEVEVQSPTLLNPEQLDRITRMVQRLTGKTAEIRQEKDPGLLGGLIVRMGNTVIDNSLKNHFEKIRRTLTVTPNS